MRNQQLMKSQKLEMAKKCIQVLPGTAVDPPSPASPLSSFGLPYSGLVSRAQCLYLRPYTHFSCAPSLPTAVCLQLT